ncbi:hypothetical protein EOM60_02330 [Candidatus Saccharibacteria bacterium]|nr:hypothetical protein [Candidatus Saccharibacteria bacterium]
MDQVLLGANNLWWVIPLVIWSVTWKAMALWKSARSNNLAWFVVMFFINTAGVLEILYIFVFSKPQSLTQD